MPGSRVNLGMGQPGRKPAKAKAGKPAKADAGKKAKGTAVKKTKGGAMMKPPGMKGGGGVEDPTLPDGKFGRGGGVKKKRTYNPAANEGKIKPQKVTPRKNTRQVDPTVPDESGGRRLRPPPNPGAARLPKTVRNKMGFMNQGGAAKKAKGAAMMKPPPKMAKGGSMYKKGKKSGPKP